MWYTVEDKNCKGKLITKLRIQDPTKITYVITYCLSQPSCGHVGHKVYVEIGCWVCECTKCRFKRGVTSEFIHGDGIEVYHQS